MTKKGFQNNIQRYKCASCGRTFQGGIRLDAAIIWWLYTEGKQTYSQLVAYYNCSVKTIQRKIDSIQPVPNTTFPKTANVLMDTTYFGRKLGLMVFKDSITGSILFKQYVKQETNILYLNRIKEITRRGIKIQSIICDGKKGLFQLFSNDIPIQMCNIHHFPFFFLDTWLSRFLKKLIRFGKSRL